MATFASIFPPASERATTATLGAGASSASIVLGSSASGTLVTITVSADSNIRFGNAANIANPTADDFPIWANSYVTFQLPTGCDRFRLFSTAGAIYWYWPLGRG